MKKGFTLVELLAVIAILAILVIIALPNVMGMFNTAKKNSFNTELKTIYGAAQTAFIKDSLLENYEGNVVYSRVNNNYCNRKLDLTGRTNLSFYIELDRTGKVVKYYASDNTFQFKSDSEIKKEDITIDKVERLSDGVDKIEITCSGIQASCNKKNIGDEVVVANEPFIVVNSDCTKTILLAKYNLYVGSNVRYNSADDIDLIHAITSSDTGYGMQNENAKGYVSTSNEYIGNVAFSGKGYWDSGECKYIGNGVECNESSGLLSKYNGSYSDNNYPNVYDKNYSTVLPNIIWREDSGHTSSNDYSVSYYVEEYVNKLKSLGAPNTIEGRLLTQEEAVSLGCDSINKNCNNAYSWVSTSSYWLSSASSKEFIWDIDSTKKFSENGVFSDTNSIGVRPVIEINTSDLL